eukprot:CAMPEP_0168749140 /NCGR_PEP_ID=MMETSP0724-20121128/16552_1 /TAXON_ID=265536 /ORGANISM="Amphiprora sp., Strain CCMP467" /LENGTH=371 /DNA_ID=CAMNT_0008797019 /DNA_START=11 /DNA_END=1123 /DNA_ORIENTATION=-
MSLQQQLQQQPQQQKPQQQQQQQQQGNLSTITNRTFHTPNMTMIQDQSKEIQQWRISRPLQILNTGVQGVFIPITTKNESTYQFQHKEPLKDLIGPLFRYTKGELTLDDKNDESMILASLRNKSLLLVGDSTDYNVLGSVCCCRRTWRRKFPGIDPPHVKSTTRVCSGSDTQTWKCHWPSLNLTINAHGAEYGIHPYGARSDSRIGAGGTCDDTVPLKECLFSKWKKCSNGVDSIKEMHDGLAAQPDIAVINVNLWFWYRLQYYRGAYEMNHLQMDPSNLAAAYLRNLTIFFEAAQEYLPNVSTWLTRASLLPRTSGRTRISADRVSLINGALKDFTDSNRQQQVQQKQKWKHIGFMDWQAMASNLNRSEI